MCMMQATALSPLEEQVNEVETQLGALFRLVAQSKVRTAEGQPPLERAGYVALSVLHDNGPLRTGALAALLGVDVSTASRQATALETAGLVLRDDDPDDGRACLLSPTALGVETLTTVRRARRASLSHLLAAWPESDREAFAALLARFTSDLDEAGTLNHTPTAGSSA